MGSNCYGCKLLEFVAARISRIHFAQRYVMCVYGVRITFVLFTPVPETGCPMWHAGLTLTLAVSKSVSIVSLDLSKAFDRDWSKLWAALASHGVSRPLETAACAGGGGDASRMQQCRQTPADTGYGKRRRRSPRKEKKKKNGRCDRDRWCLVQRRWQ